jgi:hypothetical protein
VKYNPLFVLRSATVQVGPLAMEKVTGGVEMRVDGGRVDRNTLFPVATLTGRIGSPLTTPHR